MSRSFRAALGLAVVLTAGAAPASDLPEAIRTSGTLHLAVNATYAPMEYHDAATNELTGLDIELATALAKRLGVKIEWTDVPFEQLIPSLQTGCTDFIISGFSDRSSRRELADFVDYLTTGPQFFTLVESHIKVPADLCGMKVGTVRSTSFPVEIDKWSKVNCEANGKPVVQFVPGENSIDVRNQLKQGRIGAAVQGSEPLPYAQSNEPGRYRVIGEPIAHGYQGIAFRKSDVQLREAVTAALRGLIADGTYKTVLTKYGLAANAARRADAERGGAVNQTTLADGFPDLSGLPVARRMHWGRWLAAALIVLMLLALARAFAYGQIEWAYVGRFLTVPLDPERDRQHDRHGGPGDGARRSCWASSSRSCGCRRTRCWRSRSRTATRGCSAARR